MAPITKTLALAGALFAISGAAAPVDKRAVVWETVTDVVWTTVDVTTTIYPNQGKPTATATVIPVTTTAAAVPTTTAAAVPTTTAAAVQEEDNKPAVQAIPTTSSSSEVVAPAPEPTTTEQAPVKAAVTPAVESSSSTSSAAPVETATARSESTNTGSSSSSSSGSSGSSGYTGACSEGSPCTGQMTYYDTATLATNPSSCGTTNDGETELVLALPVGIMKDSDCGKTVTIEYNGVTQTAKAVDKCMGCDDSSIDLSRALFEKFASFSAGRLSGAKWYIN